MKTRCHPANHKKQNSRRAHTRVKSHGTLFLVLFYYYTSRIYAEFSRRFKKCKIYSFFLLRLKEIDLFKRYFKSCSWIESEAEDNLILHTISILSFVLICHSIPLCYVVWSIVFVGKQCVFVRGDHRHTTLSKNYTGEWDRGEKVQKALTLIHFQSLTNLVGPFRLPPTHLICIILPTTM